MIGSLTDRVTLLTLQTSPDEGGGEARSYVPAGDLPADLQQRRSREQPGLSPQKDRRRYDVIIRRRDGLKMTDRLQLRGGTYRITDIQPAIPRHGFTFLSAEEVLP